MNSTDYHTVIKSARESFKFYSMANVETINHAASRHKRMIKGNSGWFKLKKKNRSRKNIAFSDEPEEEK